MSLERDANWVPPYILFVEAWNWARALADYNLISRDAGVWAWWTCGRKRQHRIEFTFVLWLMAPHTWYAAFHKHVNVYAARPTSRKLLDALDVWLDTYPVIVDDESAAQCMRAPNTPEMRAFAARLFHRLGYTRMRSHPKELVFIE